jgi:hypothetical protein
MSFFEPPEPPPVEPNKPIWLEEPVVILGGMVTARILLARTDTFAMAITRIIAYPTGFSMRIVTVAREGAYLPGGLPQHPMSGSEPGTEPDFRFGLLLADGTKVLATRPRPAVEWSTLDRPPSPMLTTSGFLGVNPWRTSWRGDYWATPLPPSGPLGFVVQWGGGALAETSVTIDAKTLLDAAATAESIWDTSSPPQVRPL